MQRNTMSITICTLDILKKDPSAIILALPADHIIKQKKFFFESYKRISQNSRKKLYNNF